MWNLVVMYGGGPLEVLSFAEDNIVGTLKVRPLSGTSHARFIRELTVQMWGTCPKRFRLSVEHPIMVIQPATNRI